VPVHEAPPAEIHLTQSAIGQMTDYPEVSRTLVLEQTKSAGVTPV
jgi:hypothetical protein